MAGQADTTAELGRGLYAKRTGAIEDAVKTGDWTYFLAAKRNKTLVGHSRDHRTKPNGYVVSLRAESVTE